MLLMTTENIVRGSIRMHIGRCAGCNLGAYCRVPFGLRLGISAVPYLSRQRMKLPRCTFEELPGWAA